MTSAKFDAVFIGVATIDTIALLENYPTADSRTLTDQLTRAGGGVAATAAVAAARLGANVAFAGVVGDDAEGKEIIAGLNAEGVNTDLVIVDPASVTATSVVIVTKSSSSRAIITRQQVNYPACVTEKLRQAIAEAKIVHLDHAGYGLIELLKLKRGAGPKISLDHGNEIKNFNPALVDIYVPSDVRLLEINPGLDLTNAVTAQANKYDQDVIVTAGSGGSLGMIGKQLVSSPSVDVEVISTLGAGDVFHGAIVVQYLQQQSPKEMLRRANAVAGLSCQGIDGRSAIPTAAELENFLANN